MFEISESNTLDLGEYVHQPDDVIIAELSHNEVEPRILSDGVDWVTVTAYEDAEHSELASDDAPGTSKDSSELEECYRLDYGGYLEGAFIITRDGLAEFGQTCLGDSPKLPYWILSLGAAADGVP